MEVNKVYNTDALSGLQDLPDGCVDMCVTSPPYWGLRDYGVKGQLGLEPDFHEYITKLVAIFDEVHRVLKDTGTLWVNISDSYYSKIKGNGGMGEKSPKHHQKSLKEGQHFDPIKLDSNIPIKSLVGVPERFVIAMTDRGWIRRNTIVWHKPNCMPSSVKDRFTVDFEYLYFFSKSRKYYFEQQTEPAMKESLTRYKYQLKSKWHEEGYGGTITNVEKLGDSFKDPNKRNMRCVWRVTTKPYKGAHFAVFPEDLIETPIRAGCPPGGVVLDPFMGSGTTASVAKRLGRDYVGFELNPEYMDLISERLRKTVRIKSLKEYGVI